MFQGVPNEALADLLNAKAQGHDSQAQVARLLDAGRINAISPRWNEGAADHEAGLLGKAHGAMFSSSFVAASFKSCGYGSGKIEILPPRISNQIREIAAEGFRVNMDRVRQLLQIGRIVEVICIETNHISARDF